MSSSQSICWFDLPTLDLKRAITFYSKVLAIKLKKEAFDDFEMAIFPHSDSMIGGCLYKNGHDKPSGQGILVYFNVDGRLEKAEAEVKKNKGKILEAKHAIGPHGFRSIVLDSEGNRIALHSTT